MVYGLDVKPEWGFEPKRVWDGEDQPAKKIPALAPADDGGVSGDNHLAGVPVDGSNFPSWVRWSDPNGNPIPDFDSIPYLNVSLRAREVIESLETGVHQFFPVQYQDAQGNSIDTRYWLVPCHRIDSVDREHSNMVLRNGLQWVSPKQILRRGENIPEHVDALKSFSISMLSGTVIYGAISTL